MESIEGRPTTLGELEILRLLPRRQRRTIGAWCFLDRYGPLTFSGNRPMDVAPHPHIGLQTVSWLMEGEIIHKDSLGCEAVMRAGQLNLMTSGRGIAHSEETPADNSGRLSGVQLWVALPEEHRNTAAAFNHYPELPRADLGGGTATLIAGELQGARSPARIFSPLVGAEIAGHGSGSVTVALNRQFEHGILVLTGTAEAEGNPLSDRSLYYLPAGRDELRLAGSKGFRVLLIGGEPFEDPIVMWWNFVAGTREEIAQARSDWEERRRFGDVSRYNGPRIEAPELVKPAPAEPIS
jgi:redox-sensitive bicupin YhaK (pirin superfamily)